MSRLGGAHHRALHEGGDDVGRQLGSASRAATSARQRAGVLHTGRTRGRNPRSTPDGILTMALPKRRQSKARGRKRRTHDRLTPPNVPGISGRSSDPNKRSSRFYCPSCRQPKEAHAICANCGAYGKRQAVEVSEG